MDDATNTADIATTGDHAEERFKAVQNHLSIMEAMIESEAIALMDEFRTERDRLKHLAKTTSTPVPGVKPVGFYSPLNMGVRAWKGTLEIYWFEQHVTKTKARVYKYLRRNAGARGKGTGGYNLPALLARANPYERELVESIERRATELRCKRSVLVKARGVIRELSRWYVALPDAPAEVAPIADDGSDATGLVPLALPL